MSDAHEQTPSISDSQIRLAGILGYMCTIPGTIVCGLVLVAYAMVAYFPKARGHLDRVSFRLLVQALLFNVLFGIAYSLTPTHPGPGCEFNAFVVNFTISFATFYTTCIAMNLQVNGKMMEKYYVIVTLVLSCAINIPTYALGEFGWNESSEICWYSNPDDRKRLQWIIGTQSFWMALAAVIETFCSCIVLYWLYLCQRDINSLNRSATPSTSFMSDRVEHSGASWFPNPNMSTVLTRNPRIQRIIIRICLYPLVSLILNFGTLVLDLNMSIVGVKSQLDFRLLVVDLMLYGVRTFAYGMLAFWDPSFINAIREIRRSRSSLKALTNLDFAETKGIPSKNTKLDIEIEGQEATTSSDNSQTSFMADVSKVLSQSGEFPPKTENSMAVLGPQEREEERRSIERQL
ncbi:hypothetical protein FPV67DRAFT_1700201 [Lyophyllum atratum]|nr:hypothetical protein FPV67DRAFT_1700201 [Lyophyllum atratum]